jgi:two-component system, OmpR family, heavy metal sensor histidine kinase CusS
MRRPSIGVRLTLWFLLIFAAAQSVSALGMWLILRYNLYDIADDALENQIDDVRSFLNAQDKNASLADLQEAVRRTYVLQHAGDYLQIRDERGDWIYRSGFLQKMELPAVTVDQLREPLYEDRHLGRRHFRFLTEQIGVNGQQFIVQTGIPEGDVVQTLVLFQRYLWMFAPFMLLVAAGGGYWLSRRALAPVDALTRTARGITGANLSSRLEQLSTGDEMQRLSDTLNEMLARIEAAFLRVNQFTSDASHELRTPIALIRTEAEVALLRSRNAEEYRDALTHILEEAERTSLLIDKLLSLARSDAGKETLEISSLDLREMIARTADDWRQTMAGRKLKFAVGITDQEVLVQGDRMALTRLLNILLDNAVKYTPEAGNIQMSLEVKENRALICVCDSGIGINEEDRPKIFERFYRADKARSRKLGGAGLGLAIAHWIVQQHEGSISVESAPGDGSTFVVELPLSSQMASVQHG